MDFGFSQQEESFRKEVREFIQKEFLSELRWQFRPTFATSIYGLNGEAWKFMKAMSRKFGAKGWLSLSWPKEYGGQDALLLQNIVYEEVLYHNCPGIDPAGAMACPTGALRFLGRETGTAGEHMRLF